MPDEPQLVRGIDWKSTFPFTLIFRSFRIAIHPSKLVLALAAMWLIVIGGWVLDTIWVARYLAVPNEITIYKSARTDSNPVQSFTSRRDAERKRVEDNYRQALKESDRPDGGLGDIRDKIIQIRDKTVDDIRKLPEPAEASDAERARLTADREQAIASVYEMATARYRDAEAINGVGLFRTFALYQIGTTHLLLRAGSSGNWLGPGGVLDQLVDLLTVAPGWAIRYHPAYFILFGIYFLVVWAVFGGAISRIAAVQVARDEKISFRQALSFSSAKFLSFVSAPVIPLAIIMAVGLVVTAGAFVTFNVPYIGPIIGGALFFLALAAGFIMTLVFLGLLGGFNLMYPTIAVEGSDSFDAISRSFSYLFARPWRLVFYTLVGGVYGTFCYAFVRVFIKLMLAMTHGFAGMGVVVHAQSTKPLWPVMWPDPLTASQLSYSIDSLTLNGGQNLGAHLLAFWVYLAVSVLGAFAISFYFSANTVIYILMRHEVDATELDDVYLEQTDEDFAEAATVSGAVSVEVTENAPGAEETGAAPAEEPKTE